MLLLTIVYLATAILLARGNVRLLRYGKFQGTILGLTFAIPTMYMLCLEALNFLGKVMFSMAAILGGTDLAEFQSRQMTVMANTLLQNMRGDGSENDEENEDDQ